MCFQVFFFKGNSGGKELRKWSRYWALPLVVKWGSHGTLTPKKYFPIKFRAEIRATDEIIQKHLNTANNRKSDIQLQYGGQKIIISNFPPKMGRPLFPDYFHKIRLKLSVQIHCWYKNCQKIIRLRFYGEKINSSIKMLINAISTVT